MIYPWSRVAAGGFTQLELMLALGLGSGLCLVAAQYYQYAVHLGSVQEHLEQRAERILVLELTAGAALRRAMYSQPICLSAASLPVDEGGAGGSAAALIDSRITCPAWLGDQGPSRVVVETADTAVGSSIVPDADIVTIHETEIGGVTQYFTARHQVTGYSALYRRRAATDEAYQAAEELVIGWSDLSVSGCYEDLGAASTAWHCDSVQGLVEGYGVLRVCARHADLPEAVSEFLGTSGVAALMPHTCVVVRTL